MYSGTKKDLWYQNESGLGQMQAYQKCTCNIHVQESSMVLIDCLKLNVIPLIVEAQ